MATVLTFILCATLAVSTSVVSSSSLLMSATASIIVTPNEDTTSTNFTTASGNLTLNWDRKFENFTTVIVTRNADTTFQNLTTASVAVMTSSETSQSHTDASVTMTPNTDTISQSYEDSSAIMTPNNDITAQSHTNASAIIPKSDTISQSHTNASVTMTPNSDATSQSHTTASLTMTPNNYTSFQSHTNASATLLPNRDTTSNSHTTASATVTPNQDTTPQSNKSSSTISEYGDDIASQKPSSNSGHSVSTLLPSDNPTTGTVTLGIATSDSPAVNTGDSNCYPWFSCVHGLCTGGMSCECFQGWAGLFCDVSCPSDCAPNGTCITNAGNQAQCVCNGSFTYLPGLGCVEVAITPTTTTTQVPETTTGNLRPLLERDCLGIFTCVYGYCQIVSLTCECDPGWKGQLCDQVCGLDCGEHGRCRESQDYVLYCECESMFSGEHCETAVQTTTNTDTTTTAASTTVPPVPIKAWDFNSWFNQQAAGDNIYTSEAASQRQSLGSSGKSGNGMPDALTTLRPMGERECKPNFICKHGYCVTGSLECVCDTDWGGLFCEMTCTPSCGQRETCVILDGEEPYCRCDDEESEGGRCGDPETTPTSSKTSTPWTNQLSTTPAKMWDPWPRLEALHGILPPLTQRFCRPGFVCAYGNCSDVDKKLKCLCQDGFVGIFCEIPCPLDCGDHGTCTQDEISETFECECNYQYTGLNCSDIYIPDEGNTGNQQLMWALSLAAALFLLSIFLLVVLPICLYRKRNITMMKLWYWFQPFEEDGIREYDAFVSFSSANLDRQFVLQTLVPVLEGRMCFNLCIHPRNFVPGQFISDNIVDSVKRSRRTLLIISPSFVSSSWCKFEYQMALQEMLSEKHRVLPIIIGDITSIMNEIDETLKRILKTVTWLEYPGPNSKEEELDRFWTRLQLSMPKKRSNQPVESGKPQSCLVAHSIHLPLPSSLEKPANPKPASFVNGSTNNRLLQRIIRVPGSDLNSVDKNSTTSPMEDILETHPDTDSQNGTIGSSSCEIDLQAHSSQASLADSLSDVYSSYSSVQTEQIDPVSENQLSKSLEPEPQIISENPEAVVLSVPETEPKDIPTCMLDNYLGNIELGKSLTV